MKTYNLSSVRTTKNQASSPVICLDKEMMKNCNFLFVKKKKKKEDLTCNDLSLVRTKEETKAHNDGSYVSGPKTPIHLITCH